MEAKHTPGPWLLESIFPNRRGYNIRGGSTAFRRGLRLLAVVKNQDSSPLVEDARMDAHLIAAAPDLLRELKHLVSLMWPLEQNGGLNIPGLATLNGARAAIAKAEGRA